MFSKLKKIQSYYVLINFNAFLQSKASLSFNLKIIVKHRKVLPQVM